MRQYIKWLLNGNNIYVGMVLLETIVKYLRSKYGIQNNRAVVED